MDKCLSVREIEMISHSGELWLHLQTLQIKRIAYNKKLVTPQLTTHFTRYFAHILYISRVIGAWSVMQQGTAGVSLSSQIVLELS